MPEVQRWHAYACQLGESRTTRTIIAVVIAGRKSCDDRAYIAFIRSPDVMQGKEPHARPKDGEKTDALSSLSFIYTVSEHRIQTEQQHPPTASRGEA